MNLELIEEKCLQYLKQVSNPLADSKILYQHLLEDPEVGELSYPDLLSFMRHHTLFRVIEPVGLAVDADSQRLFGEAGISITPRVILSTRVPTQAELAQAIQEQLDRMTEALLSAARTAEQDKDHARTKQLMDALKRTEILREKLKAFL